jgi:hypothetical protein
MESVLSFLERNIPLLIVLVVVLIIVLGLVAFILHGTFVLLREQARSGRKVKVWGIEIGEGKNSDPATSEMPFPKLSKGSIFLKRQDIPWAALNALCRQHYWVCGTSIQGILSYNVIETVRGNGVSDIKLILPSTESETQALLQLEAYDTIKPKRIADVQVASAKSAYKVLLGKFAGSGIGEHLRRYRGIMFSNITIIDHHAIISFYDDQGVGNDNITLHFTKEDSPNEFKAVVEIFHRLWHSCD